MNFILTERIIWRSNLRVTISKRSDARQLNEGINQEYGVTKMSIKTWIKRLGFWGFMFFLVKGLLWLTIPALIAFFAN